MRRKVSGETKLPGHPFQLLNLDDDHFQKFERLTVILYDKTSHLNSVNETRRELFCQRNRAMDKLPPTKDALLQHVRRAGRHLDVQHRGTTSGSVSTGFCLDQRVRLVGTSLGDNFRGFQVVQRANQMRRQMGLLQLQMWQSKSGLLTTLQVQLLTACNRCLYLLA